MTLDRLSRLALYGPLLWSPLAFGAVRPWPLAVLQLLTLLALLLWVARMAGEGRLEWRRSAVDLPLLLLVALVMIQLLLGNRPLAAWALAPPPTTLDAVATLPSTFPALGTVAPGHTARSLAVFLTYAAVYVLVVNVVRTREQLERLVVTLLAFGGVLGFAGLLDYLTGNTWLAPWRDIPIAGRVAATFLNPDHFAAWLAMVACLGLGLLAARLDGRTGALGSLRSRQDREELIRRYLPFVGVAAIVLALIFTLSRGGLLSLAVTLVVLLALLGRLGRIRWSVAVVGAVVVVAVAYATWIGLDPLLARVRHADYVTRWILVVSTLPMLRAFPVFGVGLGAYGEAYYRYQPPALLPGKLDPQFAHNDLLQLVVELGLVGAAIAALLAWRVGRDLVAAHLLGSGACPVGGGEDDGARRHDPFSLGLAVGAVGAVLALLVHSAYDFSARIPANGVLASACLGIATVALHTRFTIGRGRVLTAVGAYTMGSRVGRRAVVGGAMALSLVLAAWIVRPVLVRASLGAAERPGVTRAAALRHADRAVALDATDERARELRARLRLGAALETWKVGGTLDGRVLMTWEERQREALPLVRGAIVDLRAAVAAVPVGSFAHESLGRAYGTLATLDGPDAPRHLAQALTSFSRAIAVAPTNPRPYRVLALFATPLGGQATLIGLRAARGAVERDPELLTELVDQYAGLGLGGKQWLAAVPDSAVDRLELGTLLEARHLLSEAAEAYRGAVELATAGEAALTRWRLARLLVRRGHGRDALAVLETALAQDPANPELHLERARALEAVGDADALQAYRLAVLNAEVLERRPADQRMLFGPLSPRARALVAEATAGKAGTAARYRRVLAQHLNDRRLWAEALKHWDALADEAPRSAAAHFGRAVALDGIGGREAALDAYRQAVALDGSDVGFRLRLAQRLWESDQYYQAINEWRAVLARAPGNVEARLALARAHVRTGSVREASLEYQLLLLIAPDRADVRQELSRLGRGAPTGSVR